MALPKAKNTPGSTGYRQSSLEREEGSEQRTLALRLPNSDIEALKFLWCELASRIGLRSNMQSQRAELAKRSRRDPEDIVKRREREKARRREKRKQTAAEELSSRAADALAALPEHVRASLAPEEPKSEFVAPRKKSVSRAERRNGILVAKGAFFSCMALGVGQSGGRVRKVLYEGELMSELLDAEVWADRKNEQQSQQTRECRNTLLRMIEIGDGDLVNVLFLMYANAQPPSEFSKLEDLAPLALDTPAVLRHAALMTKRLRADMFGAAAPTEDSWALARMQDRRESVTQLTAIRDLLDRKSQETPERTAQRTIDARTIKTEATRLLICASVSYQRAKKSLPAC